MNKLHMVQLEILIEFDRLCRKNNIKYSLSGGTLLGAVRHKGFIPWDDDADVEMLRTEYERFVHICAEQLDQSRFYFQDHMHTSGYRWGYGKLRRKETLFVRAGQEFMPYEQGVFIDIFPFDAVPKGKLKGWIHNLCCFCIRKILWSPVGAATDASWLMRFIYRLLALLPINVVFSAYEKYIRKYNALPMDRCPYVRSITFPCPQKRYYEAKRDWYDNYTELDFEGVLFMVLSDYKKRLETKFGDYMTLPPEAKRKVHLASKIKI